MKKGVLAFALLAFFIIILNFVSAEIISKGPNWDRTCSGNICESVIYSYEKYWDNGNEWEEIDESWKDCSSDVTRFCTNDYHYKAVADSNGLVSAIISGRNYDMKLSGFLDYNLSFSSSIEGNILTYDIVPGYIELKYYYFPDKLKEEIIIKQPLNRLIENDFNLTFTKSGEGDFVLERPYICDRNMDCKYLDYSVDNNIIVNINKDFLDNAEYPVIIDPTILLNSSNIDWNGYTVNNSGIVVPPYGRTDNPTSISLSSNKRGSIDWNTSSIPNQANILNATLILTTNGTPSNYNISIREMEGSSQDYPNTGGECDGNCNFYIDMINGTEYVKVNTPGSVSQKNYTLSSDALDDIKYYLNEDWFGTGLIAQSSGSVLVAGRDYATASLRPKMYVTHSYESYDLIYDANGNLIQGFGKYLEYDGWHRVSRIRNGNASGSIIEEYLYDHVGNRLRKKEYNIDSNGNNRSTYYISENFINVRITNGTQYNETYYYLNNKLIAMKDGSGNKFYYHPDHLASTTLVTNQSGAVVEDNAYLPYGDLYSGDESERYLFTGKERDDTGFDYFGARYYDSRFMHFLQADSIIPDIYNPQSLNRYSYTYNNPYKYIDENGNSPLLIVGGAILGYSILQGAVSATSARLNGGSYSDAGKYFVAGAAEGFITSSIFVGGLYLSTTTTAGAALTEVGVLGEISSASGTAAKESVLNQLYDQNKDITFNDLAENAINPLPITIDKDFRFNDEKSEDDSNLKSDIDIDILVKSELLYNQFGFKSDKLNSEKTLESYSASDGSNNLNRERRGGSGQGQCGCPCSCERRR